MRVLTADGQTKVLIPRTPDLPRTQEAEKAIGVILGLTEAQGEKENSGLQRLFPPKGTHMIEDGETMTLHFHERGGKSFGLFLLLFGFAWAFIVGNIALMVLKHAANPGSALAGTFSLLAVFCFGVLYGALALLMNSRFIRIGPEEVRQSSGPFPGGRSRLFSSQGLTGVREQVATHRYDRRTGASDRSATFHSVVLDYENGSHRSLLGDMTAETVHFLVQAIQERMIAKGAH